MSDDMAIVATPAAIQHLKKHLSQQKGAYAIRLNLIKSGCSGYRYEVTPVSEAFPPTELDKVFALDPELSIYVSRKIFPMVMGTKMDYLKKGLGGGELVYDNPQQTGACGCGESISFEQQGE